MNPNREEALFAAALERPAEKRADFLDGACLGDAALRERVEALLAAHEQPATELGEACESAVKADEGIHELDEAVGQTLGRYKLLERVGEGGCGVVYVAEQKEPVRRKVALKVIKLGMDTKQVVARFEAERQALAMMDHPNIAKVLDAGTTDVGRPYFVMELVRGVKITDYCDQANLTTKERLDLFIKVCHAIQHAHQKGIIHRDIKPSNILVTLHDGVPVPKVIDFGIAKATQGELTDKTIHTQFQQFIGTPAYMSPEQAEMSGLDIDTRSDIYSLGVLLYELLAGSTPFDAKELMSQGIDAMRKTIREKEPVRPSTRLTQRYGVPPLGGKASAHSSAPDEVHAPPPEGGTPYRGGRSPHAIKELIHQLQGDLDWIVMKCLEKDRQRRYETANALAADLKRHLNNEPVVARPPSATYKLRKAWRRNKVVFTAGAAVALALVIGVAVSVWQAKVATEEKSKAVLAGEQARNSETQKEIERRNATQERDRAEAARLMAGRHAYASDMNLAQAALNANNLGRALSLLDRHRPRDKSELDLRGWEWRYLWGQCRSDAQATVWQGTNDMRDLAVSHDGKFIAIAEAHPGKVHILDGTTFLPVGRTLPASDQANFIAFSPTENWLATSFFEDRGRGEGLYSVRLWNPDRTDEPRFLSLEGECVGLKFCADGRRLVAISGGQDGLRLDVWRIPDGELLAHHRIAGTVGDALADNFSVTDDSGAVAFGLEDHVRVIDLATGQERWSAKAGEEVVLSVAFSPDGALLATGPGYADSTIRLWDSRTGKELAQLHGHDSLILALHFWPDGKTLASASGDQTIRLWDLSDLPRVPQSRVLRGHQRQVWMAVALPDQRTLLSASQDKTVRRWDTATVGAQRIARILPVQCLAFQFAPDGNSVLTVDESGRVDQWHGPAFRKSKIMELKDFPLASAIISKDCQYLATAVPNGMVEVFDLARAARVARFDSGFPGVELGAFLHQNRSLLLADSADGQLSLWSLDTQARGKQWAIAPRFWWAGQWNQWKSVSADERSLFTAGYNGQASLWNMATGQEIRRDINEIGILRSSFAHSGDVVAICTLDGTIRLVETTTLRDLQTLGQTRLSINDAEFSEDDQRVVGASTGTEAIRIWDRNTSRDVLTLHTEVLMNKVSFSPGENFLGSLDSQRRLHIWRAPSWEEIAAADAKEKSEIQRP